MSAQEDFTGLLTDPDFRPLLNEMARRCVPWEEFLGLPQPRDMSPLESWRVLNEINTCVAIPIPVPDLDDNPYWYRRTHQIDDAATTIRCACSSGSHLHETMTASSGQHFLVKSRIDETVAAAKLDGLAIPEEDAKVLLRLDRAPQSDTERLLVNTFRAFDHLRDLLDEPFSRELFTHMRDLLLDSVDPEGLGSGPPLQGILARTEDQDAERQRRFAGRQMDLIAAYLNRESSDPDDLPVLQGQVMADAFRFYRPLGNVSSQVGRLSARLFALKNGLPVLGLLPISRAKVDWETGLINPPLVSLDRRMHVELNQRSPRDVTPHQTLAAQLTLITLMDLESHIEAWERRDEEMREILRRDPALNHRQRSVLARALRDPEAEFRIRYHKTNHSIHYTTARRDLLELQEKGYLLMEQRGKAFVFLPGPGLGELQAARAGRDDSSRHFARAPRR